MQVVYIFVAFNGTEIMQNNLKKILNIKFSPNQKKDTLIKAAIALAVVIILAIAVSALTGNDEKANNSDNQATDNLETALDIKADNKAASQESAPQNAKTEDSRVRIPSNQKYDFEASPIDDFLNSDAVNSSAPAKDSASASSEVLQVQTTSPEIEEASADIYPETPKAAAKIGMRCGEYASEGTAQETKAQIAFIGIGSKISSLPGGKYTLDLGPFDSKDEAKKIFSELDSHGLVSSCSIFEM